MTLIVGGLEEGRRHRVSKTQSRHAIHDGQFFFIVVVFLIVVNMAIIAYNQAFIEWMIRDLKSALLWFKDKPVRMHSQDQVYSATTFRVAPSLWLMV